MVKLNGTSEAQELLAQQKESIRIMKERDRASAETEALRLARQGHYWNCIVALVLLIIALLVARAILKRYHAWRERLAREALGRRTSVVVT